MHALAHLAERKHALRRPRAAPPRARRHRVDGGRPRAGDATSSSTSSSIRASASGGRRPSSRSSRRSSGAGSARSCGAARRGSTEGGPRRDADRDRADRRPRRLGARAREERPAPRRTSAARVRDRDRAPERRLRTHRRLDRQRGDRQGRPLVRRRRAVSAPGGASRPRPRRTSSGSPGRCRSWRSATTSSRSSARRTPSAARQPSDGAWSSSSRRPRPTPSGPSSSSSSTPARCGCSTRSAG